jgi:hypothetical protein
LIKSGAMTKLPAANEESFRNLLLVSFSIITDLIKKVVFNLLAFHD